MSYRRPWPTDAVVSDDDYCEKCCGSCSRIPPHERDDETPGDAASACPGESFLQFSLNPSPPKSNQSEG